MITSAGSSPGERPRGGSQLRKALTNEKISVVASGHSVLSARLVERAGFDAVWASGLELSASHGVPDADILGMRDMLENSGSMARSVGIPVIADCDTGYGGTGNVRVTVEAFELAGVAGICI